MASLGSISTTVSGRDEFLTEDQAQDINVRYIVVLVRQVLLGRCDHGADRRDGAAQTLHGQGGYSDKQMHPPIDISTKESLIPASIFI